MGILKGLKELQGDLDFFTTCLRHAFLCPAHKTAVSEWRRYGGDVIRAIEETFSANRPDPLFQSRTSGEAIVE